MIYLANLCRTAEHHMPQARSTKGTSLLSVCTSDNLVISWHQKQMRNHVQPTSYWWPRLFPVHGQKYTDDPAGQMKACTNCGTSGGKMTPQIAGRDHSRKLDKNVFLSNAVQHCWQALEKYIKYLLNYMLKPCITHINSIYLENILTTAA